MKAQVLRTQNSLMQNLRSQNLCSKVSSREKWAWPDQLSKTDILWQANQLRLNNQYLQMVLQREFVQLHRSANTLPINILNLTVTLPLYPIKSNPHHPNFQFLAHFRSTKFWNINFRFSCISSKDALLNFRGTMGK